MGTSTRASLYERLGGMGFFERLTESFYKRVANDELLRPLYPEDLGPPRRHLCLFLAQFWGGPRLYEAERGSPALRARHMQWSIGPLERDRWLEHMKAALEELPAGQLERAQLLRHFESVAAHLVNSAPASAPPSGGLLLGPSEVPGSIDKSHVREGLGEVAD